MKYVYPISVVMPCYNCANYVGAAIRSILEQSYTDFEFIIVNDGSTDNSQQQIEIHKDKRIRYYRLEQNEGNYRARNMGMRKAKGKYICVMDADDIAMPQRLKTQFDFLQQNRRIALVGAQGILIDKNGVSTDKIFRKACVSTKLLKTLLLLDNVVIHPSIMFRGHLLYKYGLFYNENYHFAADYDFICRCAAISPVKNLAQPLLMYRLHANQISAARSLQQSEFADQIRISHLRQFIRSPRQEEEKLYLYLVKQIRLPHKEQVEHALVLFNRILERNRILKLYDQKALFGLFDYLLTKQQEI